jgi:hypothetical protein
VVRARKIGIPLPGDCPFPAKKADLGEARPFTGTVIANFSAAEAELPDSASTLMNS